MAIQQQQPNIDLKNIKILIGTPAYNSQVHIDYVNSLFDLFKYNVQFTTMFIGNESLITRGRNTIISYFHNNKEFTHLLFLDADIKIAGVNIVRLLQHNKDVIGAPVPLKGFNKQTGKFVYNVGNLLGEEDNLAITDKIGTAVLLLSRKVVNDLINNSDSYTGSTLTRGTENNFLNYDVFKVGVINDEYYSEDYFMCKKAQELGYKMYVDTSIPIVHTGNYSFGT